METFLRGRDNCVSISSLTKVHGLGQIRYGWMIASTEIIANAENTFHNMAGIMATPVIRVANRVKPRLHEPVDLIDYYREKNLPVLQDCLNRLVLSGIHHHTAYSAHSEYRSGYNGDDRYDW